jgi:hypothetical protein
MKFICINVLLLQLLASTANAADDYAVSKINPALLAGASAIKRNEIVRFEIKNPANAVHYYKYAITILNENGDQHAAWQAAYDDKFFTIRSVDATLYDASGKKIRSLKKAQIGDVSAAGSSLADDNRVKFHNFHYKAYPYTVEYEVEIKQDQLMFMPTWQPVDDEGYAVERSVFEIVCPSDYAIRYKAYRYKGEPVITGNKEKTYHWEVNNVAAIKDEWASPEWREITPTVLVGATDFEIAGYKGNMRDWKELGKFVYNLKQNRDKLPENIKAKVHELADKEPDVKKKIEALYAYMQQNTRYISVQLGIGGWQPFDAQYVAQKKYGDCKALTNYMFSLLKEAGDKIGVYFGKSRC